MSKDENIARQGQRLFRDTTRKAKKAFKDSPITDALKDKAKEAGKSISDKYVGSGADKVVKPVGTGIAAGLKVAGKISNRTKYIAEKIDEKAGITQAIREQITNPTKELMDEKGITERFLVTVKKTEEIYGNTRSEIKPYFAPESARELLTDTQRQLTRITANILQISVREAEGWMGELGKLVSAKVAGIAGTATLFGLVSTFGTAGTGTAISTLSGGAAFNATMAALGFGGGMVTGALVLSGVGLIVGMTAYKLLSSTKRDYETLPKEDKKIVGICILLSAAIKEKLEQEPLVLSARDAIEFRQALDKLYQHLKTNAEKICKNLDSKKAVKYRQHILKDFKPVVLDGFNTYASKAPFDVSGMIGGVFYALLSNTAIDGSPEQELVLEALRRSNNDLHDASESELSEYLATLTPEQLQGVANNVKGIYHELMFVEQYNATHENTYAELHSSTTHQGSDVMIKSKETHEILEEYQLKATDSESYVKEHLDLHPDTEVIATDEVAREMDGVGASGFSNPELTGTVDIVFHNVAGNTIGDRVFESAEISGLAKAGFEAISVLQGKTSLPEAGKNTLRTAASAAAATGITAFLFGQF